MSSLTPYGIQITCQPGRKYKTIESLTWNDIPPLALLTGPNGSGKTQLLEVLAYKLTGTLPPQVGLFDGIDLQVTGASFPPESVAFLHNRWEMTPQVHIGIPQLQQAKDQMWNEFQQGQQTYDFRQNARKARLRKIQGAHDHASFKQRLPEDFSFMLEDSDVVAGLAYVFVNYRLRYAEELERCLPNDAIKDKLGPAPWDVLNQAFKVAGFPFSVVSPTLTPIADNYKLELATDTGERLQPGDLSSGEKMLLVLVLWLYNSQHYGQFPKLLLLDEPDAHLHPSMTSQFLKVIKDVLVDRFGVRVIMTTHSPSTVALAPENSLFVMSCTQPRIKPSNSTANTVGLLTSGLVVVSASTRYVLVEDEGDVAFYGTIREILSDYGPSRDERAIQPSPSVVFLPASNGRGQNKTGGGASVVTTWVNKFDQAPLSEVIRGVIDRDQGNVSVDRIGVLGRYSIENYLLDPLVVYCLLSSANQAPSAHGLTLTSGDEYRIRSLPEADLQRLADSVIQVVEPTLGNLTPQDKNLETVTFTNNKKVSYPSWVLQFRGHDLLTKFQTALGGAGTISPPRLLQSIRTLRLIPVELADIFDKIQG